MTEPGSPQSRESARNAPAGIDAAALIAPLRKHWLTALFTAALVVLAAVLWTSSRPRIFEASASLQLDANPPRPLGGKVESVVEVGNGASWDTREYYETQYQIIQSRRVALRVVEQLGLTHDLRFLRNLAPKAPDPPEAEPMDPDDAADVLRGRILVEPVKLSRIALVKVQDADPERAAKLVRAVIEAYREQNVDTVLESTDEAINWLHAEHDKLTHELESSEMSLHEYKAANNILSVEYDDKSNMLREEIGQLNSALTLIRTRRQLVSARHIELSRVPKSDPSLLPASELLQSTPLQQLRTQYIETLRERDGLLKGGLGNNHPEVLSAASRLEITRSALLSEVQNIHGALGRDLAVIGREESGVSGLLETAKKDALELNLLEIQYNRLKRQKDNTEKLNQLLLERSKEGELTRRLRVNNVSIIDYPKVPQRPVKPNVPVNLAMGGLIGIVCGVAAAFARSMLDRTVKTPGDVETDIGATFLGLMPQLEKRKGRRVRRRGNTEQPELVVHTDPMSSVAEAARSIRTNLLFMAPDKPYRTLLVTSAGPAEGKTTLACYIATVMAQSGKRVLLIDCDLRRPRVHRIFRADGQAMGPGLTSALLEDQDVDPVIETEIPNLSIVPAGPIPPNPSELLHSERFKAFLQRMRQRYDQVIIDSPPLVAVTDATILSTLVDGTIIVVRSYKTRKDMAKHGYRLLTDVGATVAGVILNAVNFGRDEYKYSYYYYQREGYYSAPVEPKPRSATSSAPAVPPN